MSPALLDVNVLLALLDRDHVDHQRARDWLDAEIASGWASCAITENGFVRIVSQPRYPTRSPPPKPSGSCAGRRKPPTTGSGPARSACSTTASSTPSVSTARGR